VIFSEDAAASSREPVSAVVVAPFDGGLIGHRDPVGQCYERTHQLGSHTPAGTEALMAEAAWALLPPLPILTRGVSCSETADSRRGPPSHVSQASTTHASSQFTSRLVYQPPFR
jgi:hypothetical protein